MRESRSSGSVEGVVCKHDSYSDLVIHPGNGHAWRVVLRGRQSFRAKTGSMARVFLRFEPRQPLFEVPHTASQGTCLQVNFLGNRDSAGVEEGLVPGPGLE